MIQGRRPDASNRSGLSLLELLISLALLAVIAGALVACLQLAIRTYDRVNDAGQNSPQVSFRVKFRSLLSETAPPGTVEQYPVSFEGDSTGFSFISTAKSSFNLKARYLRIEVVSKENTLILDMISLDTNGQPLNRSEVLLVETSTAPEFSYLDANQMAPLWRENWSNPSRIPSAVSIVIPRGSEPDWPDFVVRLLYSGSF